jgi:hypothetical protein
MMCQVADTDGSQIPLYKRKDQQPRIMHLVKAILNYACSLKEKVNAGALRALGFLMADIDIDFLKHDILDAVNAN